MPSTYSSNLKLELMATGENSGTWGNITNTNLGTAAEQAIVGYGAVSYASDANLTISITNSNAAQAARALVLNVTSAVSLTGTRELVVPTIEKQYIVQNNTTGNQSITVKTSAGTGITVPNGRKAHLYVDGTNVVQMFDFVDINGGTIDGTPIGGSSAAAGSFTTLGASGAATFNGAVTLGDAAADNITFNGTITSHLLFTDNTYDIGANGATRPRNLFLAGNATVGGNLSVGGTLTLTGGVNLNGNVTVGDTSADTLTINATITSNLLFTDNTYDIGASGATRPRNLFLAGNATIGGNQTLTGSLTVDSTTDSSSTTTGSIQTDGGLGVAKALYVGTTANIAGAVTLGGGTANGVAYLNGSKVLTTGSALTFDGTKAISFGDGSSATLTVPYSTNGNTFTVKHGVGSDTRLVFTSSGFASGNSVSFETWNGSAYNSVALSGANTAIFTLAGSEQMRLTSTGLGIGTSSPAAKLSVNPYTQYDNTVGSEERIATLAPIAAGAASSAQVLIGNGIYGAGGTENLRLSFANTQSNQDINSGWAILSNVNTAPDTNGGYLAFETVYRGATVPTRLERMRLDYSGNLGLGVTPSAWGSSYKALQIGARGSLYAHTSVGATLLGENVYDDGTAKYIATAAASRYQLSGGVHYWYTAASGTAGDAISFSQALTLDANRNLLLNGTSAGASAVGTFAIFNGTAPTGSVTDGIILYAEDVSSSSELKVRDEAGNVTTLSPHNFSLIPEGPSEDMAWAYYSEKGGKRINVDMLKLARMVEKLTGEKLVYES